MTSVKPEVVLFEGDQRSVEHYARAFRDVGLRLFSVAYSTHGMKSIPGFDALYWPLAGTERWNVRPVEDVVQVVKTSGADRAEGWPDYILAGLVLSAPNAVDAETAFRTWARALLAASKSARSSGTLRVKVPTEMIRLAEIAPSRAADILFGAEQEFFGELGASAH